jgi:hypothetical protein
MVNLRKARKELSSFSHLHPTVSCCPIHQREKIIRITDGKEAEQVDFHHASGLTGFLHKSLTALKAEAKSVKIPRKIASAQ